jgi:RNA polymerase sigma factor (sigma-70 family)
VEAHALTQEHPVARRGPAALLRLAGDERLVALTRSGDAAAFEVIVSRYQPRLLSFCARIVGSREDAEDVLQEAFAAAYNALRADARDINLRPWLYRIARNRSLNHLRRRTAIGVDSMDVHFADMGLSTSDKVFRREDFNQLVGDIQHLPESQRTALLLREVEGLSYEQIAGVMDTTIPGIKSLLVRARIGLAEASEARKLTCDEIRVALAEEAEGIGSLTQPMRRHVKSCERCGRFRKHLRSNNRALAALAPFAPLLLLKQLFATKLGAGGASVGSTAAVAGGTTAAGGGVGAVTTAAITAKALTTVAAAALLTVGTSAAVSTSHAAKPHVAQVAPVATEQVTTTSVFPSTAPARPVHRHRLAPQTAAPGGAVASITSATGTTTAAASEEVTTTTVFPGAATGASGATTTNAVSSVPPATPSAGSPASSTSTAPAPGAGGSAPIGATGSTASTGATGASGDTGSSGATGASGLTGVSGATGSSGASGATGATGS